MVWPTPPSLLRRPARSTATASASPRARPRQRDSPPGTYAIVPVATGTNLANYTVVYNNGTLTIGKATLTVTAGQRQPRLRCGQPGVHRIGNRRTRQRRHLHLLREHHRHNCLSWHLRDRAGRHGRQPQRLHRGLCQRHPDYRSGHPDGDRGQRQPRLRSR